ncbi:MAG: hypothetical protein BGO45_07070 [Microbacterium sp. 71-36]|uniref:hypothetical protein n=1 Tax=unclassified Microbacterium TaxID=2609290 RepID=UPI00086B7864|nr:MULTISPECIES: hypothetical protein [unclassified Microbacterium]MBN9211585.1 hypothetical protein [Microbacterium sp.]ODT38130.1 MAG: hypothetical protein ABS60_11255 [Microbacterium sp. SCN 71-17]ODU49990.1 MAG: hypothetical protein ABT07_03860 [Microbacterium sp. SCN 70-10]OJV75431.1 MAG: hypothetical protein BGO45_07070 [Microbacterium sp. 71-36]
MSREEHAREGAQAVLPDDRIIDVAVVMPRGSTKSGILGAAVGAGLAGDNQLAWGVAGGMVGQRAHSAAHGSFPSIVLALSETKLYILGRRSTGLVGGWKDLSPVAHIDRDHLEVNRRHSGTVRVLELTDTTTGTTLEFEAQNIGGLGLDDLLGRLEN